VRGFGTFRGLLILTVLVLPPLAAAVARRQLRPEVEEPPVAEAFIAVAYGALAILVGETLAELWGSFQGGLVHGGLSIHSIDPPGPVDLIADGANGPVGFGDFIVNDIREPDETGPSLWAWPRAFFLFVVGAALPVLEPRTGARPATS
jgi:hypothetical protein